MKENDSLRYLSATSTDMKWGLICTTVGYQNVGPHAKYPLSSHPSSYNFTRNGRVLDEYQLVYITEGSGFFQSASCPLSRVEAGTVMMLFPSEQHLYYPERECGWNEFWVGFRGRNADELAGTFFRPEQPLIEIGERDNVVELYRKIMGLARRSAPGTQQAICGIIQHLLGSIYYEHLNHTNRSNKNIGKVNRAQMLLSRDMDTEISFADIAAELNMSYSSLRGHFKQITGMSMLGYRQQQRLNAAKELLATTDKNISEIAFETGFESISRFCSFFRSQMGMSAGAFRAKYGK